MDPIRPDESVSLRDLSRTPGEVIDRVRLVGRHIEVTRQGKPAAVVVPVQWWEAANRLICGGAERNDKDLARPFARTVGDLLPAFLADLASPPATADEGANDAA